MDIINYGIIGCGMMGQEHLRNIALLPDTEVNVIFEPDSEMAARAAGITPGAKLVSSVSELLDVPDLDWPALAKPAQTVVVFMGVGTAPTIAEKLIQAGRASSTPVAVIENGTRANEIKVFGTLAELPQLITKAGIKGPALLVI